MNLGTAMVSISIDEIIFHNFKNQWIHKLMCFFNVFLENLLELKWLAVVCKIRIFYRQLGCLALSFSLRLWLKMEQFLITSDIS